MKLTRFVIEALQVIEEAMHAQVAEDLREYKAATNGYDREEWSDNLYFSEKERDLFLRAVRSKDTEMLEFYIEFHQRLILQSPFGQAFMARRPRARRTRDKAARLREVKRRDAALTMKYEVGLMRFGRLGVKWRDLDSLTRTLLNPRKEVA